MTTPYYSKNNITIFCGNCLDIMPQLDIKFDAIISDWPYGTTACSWDSIIPLNKLWTECKRVIKRNGAIVLMGSQPFTSAMIMSNPLWFKYSWVWKKNRATGHVHAKNKPMKIHEDINVFSEGNTLHKGQSDNRMNYYPQGLAKLPEGTKRRTQNDAGDNTVMGKRKSHKATDYTYTDYPNSVIEFSVDVNNEERFHPAQKPVTLIEYLIRTYTNPGDLVLDNAVGSGTTLVSAQNEGRQAVGIEISEEYCKIAVERLQQPSLFSVPAFVAQSEPVTQDDFFDTTVNEDC